MKAYERLLKYVKIDTESDPVSEDYPSTPGQVEFMKMLAGELASMEIESRLDEYGYLIAKIKANKPDVPKIALIA
ncbi:MAG TPA: peptidase T, partial [Bacillota bacterium]|nr:peptidase T [Bacillota bacterium]